MSTDVFTPEQRSAVMRAVKGRDTTPELAVRRILRAAGIGYRLGGRGLPGRPDLVMQGRRVAVFVHGCFWHGHDCPRGSREPKANAAYWRAKIARNRARDETSRRALEADGWRVVTVWECDMKAAGFADRLVAGVRGQAATVSAPASSD
ncbi:very short patch repair endonuclease [Brevundimonas sp.]|uniref:very short patch repair endonuclease n=1 Tax=Brevundimonas sp. TaxID=1871086 RepID=UPI002737D585|nr:very short patch repair endonuclease [Brevundimonas sp.]MDP3803785.1 very short patch repair endonuclease [Brevundimonas sp.]